MDECIYVWFWIYFFSKVFLYCGLIRFDSLYVWWFVERLVGYNLRDSMLIFWMFSLNYLIKFDYIIYKYLIES